MPKYLGSLPTFSAKLSVYVNDNMLPGMYVLKNVKVLEEGETSFWQ